MSNSLKERVTLLTTVFVTSLMRTLCETSLEELIDLRSCDTQAKTDRYVKLATDHMAKKPRKTTKRTRRTPASIETTAKQIVGFVTKHPNSGAEAIRKALFIPKAEWLKPIAMALGMGLKKVGKKRSTVYFAATKGQPATRTKKPPMKKARKPSVVAAGDATSTPLEPTNGTSSQVEVHPVVEAPAS